MKLIKVELFVNLQDDASTDWIAQSVSDQLEGNEELLSFHTELADPSDIGLE